VRRFRVIILLGVTKYDYIAIFFSCSDSISVDKRIHYLSHSLVCMKSDKSGAVPHVGILYQEVEDTLQVAQIQLKVIFCSPKRSKRYVIMECTSAQLLILILFAT